MIQPLDFDYRISVARPLNRGGVSAAPLERLPVLSIFDDEEYENYDYDLVPPRQRLKLAALLERSGFRQRTGRVFESENPDLPQVVFPRPTGLGVDPSRPASELVAANAAVVLVTPTQALLLYLHRFDADEPGVADELAALVWEQPGNLDKIQDWLRAVGRGRVLPSIRDRLEKAQAEGVALRKRRAFRSRLPR